jgi:hypothetical protein
MVVDIAIAMYIVIHFLKHMAWYIMPWMNCMHVTSNIQNLCLQGIQLSHGSKHILVCSQLCAFTERGVVSQMLVKKVFVGPSPPPIWAWTIIAFDPTFGSFFTILLYNSLKNKCKELCMGGCPIEAHSWLPIHAHEVWFGGVLDLAIYIYTFST